MEATCKPLGPKLAGLKIQNGEADADSLLRIPAACPEALIDFPQSSYGEDSDSELVIALGRAASSWTMQQKDEDNDIFAHVGLSSFNLERVSVQTSLPNFSEASFGAFFAVSKPKRQLDVHFWGKSDISTVLKVLTEKITSLTSFSRTGDSISV